MWNKFRLALVLALLLTTLALPAFAQEPGNDNRVCTGGSLTLDPGTSVNNLALFGCSGTVRAGATVNGAAVVLGGTLTIEQGARVNKGVAVLGGTTNINGAVGGNVTIAGGSVNLSDTAVVDGNVRVAGGSLQRASGATVRGSVSQENNPRFPAAPRSPALPGVPFFGLRPFAGGFDFLHGLLSALAFAALGAVLVVLFPIPVRRVSQTAELQAVPSVGVGCLTLIVSVFLMIGLAITIIGLPVVALLAIVEAAAWILGWISVGALAGDRILRALNARNVTPVLAVVVGVLIIALVTQVPLLGGIVWLLVGLLGLGAVILTRFGSRAYPMLATGGGGPFTPPPAGLTPGVPPAAPAATAVSMGSVPPADASTAGVTSVSAQSALAGSAPAGSVIVPSPEARPDEPRPSGE